MRKTTGLGGLAWRSALSDLESEGFETEGDTAFEGAGNGAVEIAEIGFGKIFSQLHHSWLISPRLAEQVTLARSPLTSVSRSV
jgi:hypothetical protein